MLRAGLGTGSDDPVSFRNGTLTVANAICNQGMQAFVDQVTDGSHRVQLQNKDHRGWAEFLMQLQQQDPQAVADVMEYCYARRTPIYEFESALCSIKVSTLIAVSDEDTPCIQPAPFLRRVMSTSGLWVCPRPDMGSILKNRRCSTVLYRILCMQCSRGVERT